MMMKLFETQYYALLELIQRTISNKRYKHSQRVAEIGIVLAERHNENSAYAWLAGMAHDICREMCDEDIEILTKKSERILGDSVAVYLQDDTPDMILYHGIAAVSFLEEHYPLPFEVYQAIISHTLGHPTPNTLQKIIFVADALDPERKMFRRNEWAYIFLQSSLDVQILQIIKKLETIYTDSHSITRQMKHNIEKSKG